MRILVPTGNFQYQVGNDFARSIAVALSHISEHVVEQIALTSREDLRNGVIAFDPDLILLIQGIYFDDALALEFPKTHWLLMSIDHPSYCSYSRVSLNNKRTIVTTFEPGHFPYLQQMLPKIPRAILSHPAPSDVPPVCEPNCGIVFLGSWEDPEALMRTFLDHVSWAIIDRISLALNHAFSKRSVDVCALMPFSEYLWRGNREHWRYALRQVDTLIRLSLRRRLLQELDHQGIGIDIYGNGWNAADWKNHRIHAAVTYHEALQMSASSQGVLSITPCHIGGSHERVLSCLAQGSVCITSPSSFYVEAGFVPGRDYLAYDPWEPGSLSNAVAQLPHFSSSVERRAAVPRAQELIQRNHSAAARAHQIIQLVKEHFPSLQKNDASSQGTSH